MTENSQTRPLEHIPNSNETVLDLESLRPSIPTPMGTPFSIDEIHPADIPEVLPKTEFQQAVGVELIEQILMTEDLYNKRHTDVNGVRFDEAA